MGEFLKSTVGRKYIMGITGLVWMGFIFGHMAGNMLIFLGPDSFNSYGPAIVSYKLLLYSTEAIIGGAILIHIITAITLTLQNRAARPSRYAVSSSGEKTSTWASRNMAVQGSAILAFVILHLITFKYGTYYETSVSGVVMRDLYRLLVETFHNSAYVVWYVVCLLLMMFHLSHGAASVMQSFGILERKMQANIKKGAWLYAAVVVGGFLSQPVYVYFFAK